MKKYVQVLLALLCTVFIGALAYYVTIPAINVCSKDFWTFVTTLAVVFGFSYFCVIHFSWHFDILFTIFIINTIIYSFFVINPIIP